MAEWFWTAFENPVTRGIVIAVVVSLFVTPFAFETLRFSGRTTPKLMGELYARYFSWLALAPAMILPVLAGRVWTILAVAMLSTLCLLEFAKATGFAVERRLMLVVVSGIATTAFASLDRWYGLFQAMPAIWLCLIAAFAIVPDEPTGYLRRVSVAALCMLLFGTGLGYLGYVANAAAYRPILLSILLCVELNDIFAYIAGRTFGHRKLAPNTSPGKTVGGSLGALVATTSLFALLAHFTFRGSVLASPLHGIIMGMLLSIAGQFGDLMMSSIKRDLGIKDLANTIPGHGGLLDRFDSLLLVAPAMFHYIQYFRPIAQPAG